MKTLTKHSFIMFLFLAVTIGLGGCGEESSWKSAESKNTISAYENFLKRYPQSKFSNQARLRISKLPTFAKVVIEFPPTLKSQEAYHNIQGPVWVFNIRFREVNGIAANINQKRMRIYDKEGNIWGDHDFEEIYSLNKVKTIQLSPYGSDAYESWVNSTDCKLCGSKMVLEYTGKDAKGNEVNAEVQFTMEK